MRNFKFSTVFMYTTVLTLLGCQTDTKNPDISEIEQAVSEIKMEYAPDSRVAIFDIETIESEHSIVLNGRTNLPEALATFKEKLKDSNIRYADSIEVLPASDLNGKTQGIITLSAANLRSNP